MSSFCQRRRSGSPRDVGAPPASPTQISPSGAAHTVTPAYTFNTVPGATEYSIWISTGTRWYTAIEVDPGNTGTGTIPQTTPLEAGTYGWYVNARNAYGISPWSPVMLFSVPEPP